MVKKSIIFEISGIAQTIGVDEAKKEGWWARLTNKWTPGKYFLTQRVKRKDIPGKGQVSVLKIELVEQGKEEVNVFYEWLLNNENLNKNFAIQDLELDKTEYQAAIEYLIIPRSAYYNLAVDVGSNPTPADLVPSTWTCPDDATIERVDDATLNQLVDEYNHEIENNSYVKRFKYFEEQIASYGIFYEVAKEKNINDYWNNTMPADAKSGIAKVPRIGESAVVGGTPRTAQEVKNDLKRLTKRYANEILPAKKKELTKLENWVMEWKSQGNLNDFEHNDAVDNWQKSWDENEVVKNYQALINKIANEDKYKKFKTQFEQESSKEVNGVKANQDLAAYGTPEKIDAADVFSQDDDAALARKKPIKKSFKTLRELRDKVFARKQAVIDLIENLIKNDDGGKLECPQCKKKFTALPVSSKGVNYCSEECKKQAEHPDQNNLSQTKTTAISAINSALNQDPKVETSELDLNYQNWETKINGLNKVEEVSNFKDLVLSNINQKREQKKSNSKIDQLTNGLPSKSGSDLTNDLKELADMEEKDHYQTKKTEISQAEDRVWTEDQNQFKNLVKEIVEAKMKKCKVSEVELGSEEKKIYSKINNKEHNDKDQLKKDREKLVTFVGNKEVEKKIKNLKKDVDNANSEEKKNKVKAELLALLWEDNIYVQKSKSKIQNLIKKLESSSSPTDNPESPSFPWGKVSVVILLVAGVIGLALLFRNWRNRRQEQETL